MNSEKFVKIDVIAGFRKVKVGFPCLERRICACVLACVRACVCEMR